MNFIKSRFDEWSAEKYEEFATTIEGMKYRGVTLTDMSKEQLQVVIVDSHKRMDELRDSLPNPEDKATAFVARQQKAYERSYKRLLWVIRVLIVTAFANILLFAWKAVS